MGSRARVSCLVCAAVLAELSPAGATASPWALRTMQPEAPPVPAPDRGPSETVPVPRPSPPPIADPFTAPAGQPIPPPYAGPGSTDVAGYAPRPSRPRIVDPEPRGGTGLLAGGIVVTLLGAALIGGGAAAIVTTEPAVDADNFDDGVGNGLVRIGGVILIALGVFPTLGGIAMTAVGASRVADLRRWQKRQLAPNLGRTRHGAWTLGVQLAF